MSVDYELYYWPFIPGRGEPVRLTFELGGIAYRDVAREAASPREGARLLQSFTAGERPEGHPFAPPFLVITEGDERTLHWQSAHLCNLIARREGLVSEAQASLAAGLLLTVADLMDEAHDTHHPLATGLYYEEQKDAAKVRARHFREARIPKFLGFFESHLGQSEGLLGGGSVSHVDACLWHAVAGLRYAFPKAMGAFGGRWPKLEALAARVEAHPRLADYLASERRMAFNDDGIFRCYPELDA